MIKKLFDYIKNKIFWIICLLLIIGLIISVLWKGIHITNNILNQQEQFQYQSQSQVSVNLFVSRGNIIWRNKEIKKRNDRDIMWSICKELTDLSPEKSYFAKIQVVYGLFKDRYYIYWPEFENY